MQSSESRLARAPVSSEPDRRRFPSGAAAAAADEPRGVTFAFIEEWRKDALKAKARAEINAEGFAVAFALSMYIRRKSGLAWPSVATLARNVGAAIDGENDCRSVRFALANLRRLGFIEVRRGGRGKSNFYRLRRPRGADDRNLDSGQDADDRRDGSGQVSNDRQSDSDQSVGIDVDRLYPSGMTGSSVPGNSTSELDNSLSVDAAFERFLIAFPFHETMDRSAARREFGRLTPAERDTATREAEAYRHACTTQGRSLPKHAGNWLRDRDWFRAPVAIVQFVEDSEHAVFVEHGSAEWDAWRAHRNVGSFPTRVHPVTKLRGWDFPSRSPPGIAPGVPRTDLPAPLQRAEA